MSLKIYFQYDGEPNNGPILSKRLEREPFKLKMTLPEKWVSGSCSKLLTLFITNFNKKFDSCGLVEEEMYLHCCGVDVPLEGTVGSYIREHNDVHILHKAVAKNLEVVRSEGSVLCTNFGCGRYYVPPGDEVGCSGHSKPPIFHDTNKYWSCCPHHKALDWEAFERIPPCTVGPHSTSNKPIQFKREAITSVALTDAQKVAITDKGATPQEAVSGRRCGPREFEGALHAASSVVQQTVVDGKATCRNFGCQQVFDVAGNHDSACRYHELGPVFWDTSKYWKCCPEKKNCEFDDFVKVVGCKVGHHKL